MALLAVTAVTLGFKSSIIQAQENNETPAANPETELLEPEEPEQNLTTEESEAEVEENAESSNPEANEESEEVIRAIPQPEVTLDPNQETVTIDPQDLPIEIQDQIRKELGDAALFIPLEFNVKTGKFNLPAEYNQESTGVQCSEFQKFFSVQTNILADKEEYAPGEEMSFTGELQNENKYPLLDGSLLVRVSKRNPESVVEGNFIIDEFVAVDEITLDAESRSKIDFKWKIPQGITNGVYQIDYFFNVAGRYYLTGDPFSSVVGPGSQVLKINSDNQAYVSFDKSQTKVNDDNFFMTELTPVVAKGEKAVIIQGIKNTFEEDKRVEITYELFRQNSLNEENKLNTKEETIIIPANGSKELIYELAAVEEKAYLLKITAVSGTQKSIVNIPLNSDEDNLKLEFSALTQFPLQQNNSVVLFACFLNSAPRNPQGKVILSLEDQSGNLIGKKEYVGVISPQLMAEKLEITADKEYSWLKMKAEIMNEKGEVVDVYEKIYDCKELGLTRCQIFFSNLSLEKKVENFMSSTEGIIIIIAVIVIIILLILIIRISRKNKMDKSGRSGIISLVLFILSSVFFL